MKKIGKHTFFIVTAVILLLSVLSAVGIHSYYGDIKTTWIKGINDIRWGIDIRGGVDVTFTPTDADLPNISAEQLQDMKTRIETRLVAKNITDYEIYADTSKKHIIVRFPWQSGDSTFDPEAAVKELGETASLTFRKGGTQSDTDPTLFGDPIIEGKDVKKAQMEYDSEKQKYVVALTLEETGKQRFGDATKELAGTDTTLSIWMDKKCISAPVVNEPITDGNCTISGSFTAETAQALASKINGGALPFELITKSFSTISPTLGETALSAMGLAGIIAFAFITVFMIANYRLMGVVAVIGLLGQVFGSLAVVSGFFGFANSFTLTIPGIAGIILSVGMGVDANVITDERIREELRAGKTIDGALHAGYSRAFTAIFDGNITLILLAFVLMGAFGTPGSFASVILSPFFFMFGASTAGAIYSFGYTLIVGAIFNFIFGVFACRLLTYSISKFKSMRKAEYYGGVKATADLGNLH